MLSDTVLPPREPSRSLVRNMASTRWLPFALEDKGKVLSYASFVLGALIFVSTLTAIMHSYSGVLFSDEWDGDPNPGVILHNLFAQHNEHRIVIPRLFFLADKYLFAGSNLFTLTSNVVAQLCTAMILIGVAWRGETGVPKRPVWVVGLVLGFLFSGYQYENLFWGFQIQVFLVNTFAVAAFAMLAFARANWTGLFLAALLGTAATFCLADGILVLLILPMLAIALRRPWAHVTALGVAFIFVLFIYLRGYHSPPYADPIKSLLHLDQVVSFVLIYLGAPIGATINGIFGVLMNDAFAAPRLYIGIGLLGCIITAWYGYQMMRRPIEFGPAHYVLFAVMAFVIGTAFVTALGRISFSPRYAGSLKYGTPVLIFWVTAVVLIWKARSLTDSWLGTTVPIFVGLLLFGFFVGQTGLSTSAREWRERELGAKTALLAGANDVDAFRAIHPDPEKIAGVARTLREERLSPFSESWAMWRGTPLDSHVVIAGPGRCIGSFDTIEPIPAAPGSETMSSRVQGWGWDRERGSAIAKIVLTGNTGRVAGYALSRLPRPDVVAHEPRVTDSFTGWAGHVLTARSGEIRAYGLIDHDRSACLLGAHVITG